MRVSRFKIEGQYDGKDGATVEVAETPKGTFDVRVRPKHSRESYSFPLERIAELICKGALPKTDPSSFSKPAPSLAKEEPAVKKPRKAKAKKSEPEADEEPKDDRPWYEKEDD